MITLRNQYESIIRISCWKKCLHFFLFLFLLCFICLFQNHRWELDRLRRGALFLVLITSTGVPQGSLQGLPPPLLSLVFGSHFTSHSFSCCSETSNTLPLFSFLWQLGIWHMGTDKVSSQPSCVHLFSPPWHLQSDARPPPEAQPWQGSAAVFLWKNLCKTSLSILTTLQRLG